MGESTDAISPLLRVGNEDDAKAGKKTKLNKEKNLISESPLAMFRCLSSRQLSARLLHMCILPCVSAPRLLLWQGQGHWQC